MRRQKPTRGPLAARLSRRSFAGLVTGAAAATAGGLIAPAAAHAAFETGTWYYLEARHSGLVLDVNQKSTEEGATLLQWSHNGGPNQQFRFIAADDGYHTIQIRHSSLVVDVYGKSLDNGADIVQWGDNGGPNQQWQIVDDGTYLSFVNRNSGKALDVWEKSAAEGARLSQYDSNGGTNQQFRPIPVETGTGTPTIYIASDSTAQTYNSSWYPQMGWGQKVGDYFDANTSIANHAIGGRSSRSFIEEGRLDAILDVIQPDDYLYVQFGHNDANWNSEDRFTSPEDYKMYLRDHYMAGAEALGAIPVLITPVSRLSYNEDTGEFNVSFGDYVNKVYELVDETGVAMIDLSARSRDYLNEIGPVAAEDVFMHLEPGEYENFPDGANDSTHFQEFGADQMGRIVSEGTAALSLPIADHVL
ncbi:RICIN domain-containing protein [Glycomyces sp. L485]|uniref:RICIN domain-containing protein n=1 Tax=Glycomyces sp. L485 TaxID=2909235 RepID=UPI001F4B5C0D|nr:RICIN domain-containing protein [Glycomyces sp. L485]MCH7231794.1 RICIN domain-containing protein [Glycomyces sp. L485]